MDCSGTAFQEEVKDSPRRRHRRHVPGQGVATDVGCAFDGVVAADKSETAFSGLPAVGPRVLG